MKTQAHGVPRRSDMPLASAERLAESGMTDAQRVDLVRRIGAELAALDLVLINLRDPTLTISQHDRAVMLKREVYGNMLPPVDSRKGRGL